ncbi:MAG: hypothetical protein JO034_23395 [Singulisphaera sp.]|nr:hypothetical protein [Singulisphaera sp.]
MFDGCLIAAFLALTFLLGVFPLKDTDFWWHLRTGDLIRQTGEIPKVDPYTFTMQGSPWIDLHWAFQVALSWGYTHGGVVALNLAKCVITCAAVFLLITARRREWPVWVVVLAWLPALLVLGGRMYVRPETFSLLFLSGFLAILVRWDRSPALAWLLPAIEVCWVNSQGLFVLGLIVLAFALIDAALRPGSFAPARKAWWRVIAPASLLTGAACLVNPYGIVGALYPLQLARTMRNPIFTTSPYRIAELTPIPLFIREAGWANLPLLLHVATMGLGGLSFLVPLGWLVAVRLRPNPAASGPALDRPAKKPEVPDRPRKRSGTTAQAGREPAWRLSLFRVLLFATFSVLSWQATRNSHQFAAVVGTVTAWNLGEWAAALRHRRVARGSEVAPRIATLGCVVLVFALVAGGAFYKMTGEGRTIGLGEEPLWYPHEAVRFVGRLGMPERFVGYHIGHASLYEYEHGPARKVFADARLEVIGAELYERYMDLEHRVTWDVPGWECELDDLGRPAVLLDNHTHAPAAATLLASRHWRCVWFDPVASVFVHDAYAGAALTHAVDFAARHFRPEPATDPKGVPALTATAEAVRNYVTAIPPTRADLARPLVLLGLDSARRLQLAEPDGVAGWKLLGQIEYAREPSTGGPVPRFRLAFDPVFDLSMVRATYALRRAQELAPDDFMTLMMLAKVFEDRRMDEAELAVLDPLVRLRPINLLQRKTQVEKEARREQLRARLGPSPPRTWENLSDLDRIKGRLLDAGRVVGAADLLEYAYPTEPRLWEVTDQLATLRLHLGEPARARALWEKAVKPPRPAVRAARVAMTHLVEGSFDAARRSYRDARAADPDLFEVHYGLAVLEQDAGRAAEALAEARAAEARAPSDVARAAARAIAAFVEPYARKPGA